MVSSHVRRLLLPVLLPMLALLWLADLALAQTGNPVFTAINYVNHEYINIDETRAELIGAGQNISFTVKPNNANNTGYVNYQLEVSAIPTDVVYLTYRVDWTQLTDINLETRLAWSVDPDIQVLTVYGGAAGTYSIKYCGAVHAHYPDDLLNDIPDCDVIFRLNSNFPGATMTTLQFRGRKTAERYTDGLVYEITMYAESLTPEPPPPLPFEPSGYCTFPITNTTHITGSSGITQTVVTTSTFSTPANLLRNPSFEAGTSTGPADWTHDTANPAYWWLLDGNARTGSNSVRNYPGLHLRQDLVLRGPGMYAVGVYASCTSDFCTGDEVPVYWNGVEEVRVSGLVSSTYQIFTGTNFAGTSITTIEVDMTQAQEGDVRIDDVFLLPINPDGSINCDPALYPVPDADADDFAAVDCLMYPYADQCLVLPVGGAGTACYACASPRDASAAAVSYWIAWLGCVLRNMFSCSLRVWLYDLSNSLRGLLALMIDWANWATTTTQGGAEWLLQMYLGFATYLANTPQQIAISIQTTIGTVETGVDWVEVLLQIVLTLFTMFTQLLGIMVDGALRLIGLVIDGLSQLQYAVHAPAYPLRDMLSGATGPGAYAGPDADFALSWLFLAMAMVDASVADYGLWPVIYTALGAAGLGMVMWLAKKLGDGILPL